MQKPFGVFLILMFVNSCSPITSDHEGSASYFIYNIWSQSLKISAKTNSGASSHIIEMVINPLETLKLMDDSGFGVNPTPEISFSSIHAVSSTGDIIYTQDPINNEAWIKTINNPGNTNYYHTDYTLQLP